MLPTFLASNDGGGKPRSIKIIHLSVFLAGNLKGNNPFWDMQIAPETRMRSEDDGILPWPRNRDKHKGEHIGVFLSQSQGICEIKHCSKDKSSEINNYYSCWGDFSNTFLVWCPVRTWSASLVSRCGSPIIGEALSRESIKNSVAGPNKRKDLFEILLSPQWLLRVVSIFEGTNGSQGFSSHSHKDLVGTPGGTRFSFFKDILQGGKEVDWIRLICKSLVVSLKTPLFKAIVWQGNLT